MDNLKATGVQIKDIRENHDTTGFGNTWAGILVESPVLDLVYRNRGIKLGTGGLGLFRRPAQLKELWF